MSQPLQYREGSVNFYGHQFATDSRALIPRFETEFLVSKTLEHCQVDTEKFWNIVDIGTGSGVVAVSLALALPKACITALDISPEALSLAHENALRHHVADRVNFTQSDLLGGFEGEADVILANLPYIPTSRIASLDDSVREFEPQVALDGGSDGFELYRKLLGQIAERPNKPSLCIFEFDEGQENIARQELEKILPQASMEILRDSSNLIRYIVLQFK